MPITYEIRSTPGGRKYSRSAAAGRITMDDVRMIQDAAKPGGPMDGLPSLTVNSADLAIDPDARKAFSDMVRDVKEDYFSAMVVTSAPMRVMMGFILRVTGRAENMRFFNDEAAAVEWLAGKLGG